VWCWCWGWVSLGRSALLHDARFVVPSSAAIGIEGNKHVTKAQLLSIFGGDVDRNIFTVSLAERRTELERLPWVDHATVMRLLPDHLRVSIVERTPVAFVRQGAHIGLVDKNGVLMDMVSGAGEGTGEGARYSFPVVTGIAASEPLSTRAARMKIFSRFTTELDSDGRNVSGGLSEVDLSDPEDVRALIPDGAAEVLVHFGDAEFLDRYDKYKAHLSEWKTQYPRLASVDMRYDRQVVLEMQPGSSIPIAGAGLTGEAVKSVSAVRAPAVTAPAASVPAAARGLVAVRPASKVVSPVVHSPAVTGAGIGARTVAGAAGAGPVLRAPSSDVKVATERSISMRHLTVAKDAPLDKKAAATKSVAKKTTVKRAVAKKTAAKKIAAKKTAAKKTLVKKAAAKAAVKTATKPTSSSAVQGHPVTKP
jgi:cell division protein FtsQ